MASRSKTERTLWLIGHPECAAVWVKAPNWEQATVEAARVWGLPWGKVAAGCFELQKKTLMGGVCSRCGRFYHSPTEILCDACRKIQETETARDQARARAYFQRAGQALQAQKWKGM